ncbi:hypothetical protein PENTCL1PPCAC_9540, partial [Pristionchus entomophagus]
VESNTMISRRLQRFGEFGSTCYSSSSSRDPSLKYDFLPAEAKDKKVIMDVALNHFIFTAPHCVALGITRNSVKELIDSVVSKSLHDPYCYTIIYKESGETIGFRLMSVAHRDKSKDFEPFELDIRKCEENVQILASIVSTLKEQIWDLRPEANKILRREVTFVRRDHQRRGIAQHLLHLGLDLDRLRTDGFDGVQSEATSIANQTLLAKNGYRMMASAPRKSYIRQDGQPIKFPDATKCAQLYYLSLRK